MRSLRRPWRATAASCPWTRAGSRGTSCRRAAGWDCRMSSTRSASAAGSRERWIGSTTKADNRVGPPDEGLSYLILDDGERVTLKEAVEAAPAAIMGDEYAQTHKGLGRLAKIYDFARAHPLSICTSAQKDAASWSAQLQGRGLLLPGGRGPGAAPGDLLRRASLHRRAGQATTSCCPTWWSGRTT